MTRGDAMDLELLLSHCDTGAQVLADPVPLHAAAGARHDPGAVTDGDDPTHLGDEHAPVDHLPGRRWGVIAPLGPEGDAMLARLAPLMEKRAADQGCELVPPFRVSPDMDAARSIRWVAGEFNRVGKDERPDYLLLLGDLRQVSGELQTALSVQHFTGRLALASLDGYDAYAQKVLRHERPEAEQAADQCRALTYTVRGSDATEHGFAGLMEPFVARSRQLFELGKRKLGFEAIPDPWEPRPEDLLELASDPRPTVLFSMSHGAGAPAKVGWQPGEQRHLQGAMCFGPKGGNLTAEQVAVKPFLPGGIWFYFACFGAGTPRTSAYWHWLRDSPLGASISDVALLSSLPQGTESGFLAALPQAALANPDGPLAVVGHLDLAWSFSYDGPPSGGGSHVDRFLALTKLADRKGVDPVRIGSVFHQFIADLATINKQLTDAADDEKRGQMAGAPAAVNARERARLWMMRQDLAAYMLLGDPAAHLAVAAPAVARAPRIPSIFSVEAPARTGRQVQKLPTIEEMERAILTVLAEENTAEDVAEVRGLAKDDVQAWVDAYRDAGREALRKL